MVMYLVHGEEEVEMLRGVPCWERRNGVPLDLGVGLDACCRVAPVETSSRKNGPNRLAEPLCPKERLSPPRRPRHPRSMRRFAAILGLFLLLCTATAACSLRRQVSLPSPYCRGGGALAGVYRPQRLEVKSRCQVAVGTVRKVKFE